MKMIAGLLTLALLACLTASQAFAKDLNEPMDGSKTQEKDKAKETKRSQVAHHKKKHLRVKTEENTPKQK